MKILHTSDWHLGQQFYGYDRRDEFADMLDQIGRIAGEADVDAMVVSGDLFDISSPSASISRMFKEWLLDLHSRLPRMTIVVTAGNHDSASRIDIDRRLWRSMGVYVLGGVSRGADGRCDFSDHIVAVGDKGYIAAVPFVNRAFMPKPAREEVSPEKAFFDQIAEQVAEINTDDRPVVVMAHLTVAGTDSTGHRIFAAGGVDATDRDTFGREFDYVALGHIHRWQSFDRGRISYCGTPIAVGFDEGDSHGVNIVSVTRRADPVIERVEICGIRPMVTFPDEAADFKTALKRLSKFDPEKECYLRLNVAQEDDLPLDATEQAAAKARDKRCRFSTIKYTRLQEEPAEGTTVRAVTTAEFVEASPLEIVGRFFRSRGYSEEKTAGMTALIESILSEINEEKGE
ncbi:MAG: exonuclease SbcCD subunit D [Clostridium sp.]|nr:exonuclease SbcCD subunit D [Clostridium sp.]